MTYRITYVCTICKRTCVCVCVFRLHKMSLRILFILLTLTMARMWSMPNWMPSNLSNICEIRLINGQLEADDANEAKRCTHSHTHTNSLAQTHTCTTLALTLGRDGWLIGLSLFHQPIVLLLLCGFFRIVFISIYFWGNLELCFGFISEEWLSNLSSINRLDYSTNLKCCSIVSLAELNAYI